MIMVFHMLLNQIAQALQFASQLPVSLWCGTVLVQIGPAIQRHISRG